MGAPPPGALPPISSSAEAQLGKRWGFIQARQAARVRRGAGWQEETYLPANPAAPADVNSQGPQPVDIRQQGLWQMVASSGPNLFPGIFLFDVPSDNTLVLWTVTARIYGCALLGIESPTWVSEYGSGQQQGGITQFGTGLTTSNHAVTGWPGRRYGQGRWMGNTAGEGWPVPLTGATYVYPKKTAGVFELNLTWQTGACPAGTSYLWDIRFAATLLP